MILAELTGDESLVDTGPPKREVALPSGKENGNEWGDTSSERRKTFQDDDETVAAGTVSFEAISRGGLTEHRRLGKTSDDDRASTASARSAKLGFDALRTIAQLQQQLA